MYLLQECPTLADPLGGYGNAEGRDCSGKYIFAALMLIFLTPVFLFQGEEYAIIPVDCASALMGFMGQHAILQRFTNNFLKDS
jgi:hypothetical protein